MGDFVGLSLPKQSSKSLQIEMLALQISGVSSCSECQAPCTNVKPHIENFCRRFWVLSVVTHGFIGCSGDVHGTDMESLCSRGETGAMPPNTLSFALILRTSLFNITQDFYHYDPRQKFLHTPLNGAPQKSFQSGPTLAKVGPDWGTRVRTSTLKR